MKPTDLYIIIAAVFIAPHLTAETAQFYSALFLSMWVLIFCFKLYQAWRAPNEN